MRIRNRFVFGMGVSLLVFACSGSDGSEVPGAGNSSGSTSSSSSTSGGATGGGGGGDGDPSLCYSFCSTTASMTFDENNASDRLFGITVETCRGSACGHGTLKKSSCGDYPSLIFETEPSGTDLIARLDRQKDGTLRMEIEWQLGTNTTAGVQDGDVYTVRGYFAGDGANTFEHTFTATYTDVEAGCPRKPLCKRFETGP